MPVTASDIKSEVEFFDYQSHMSAVWMIERMQFKEQAFSRDELRACMADRKNAGRVLLVRGEVIGFIIERFHTFDVEILTIAVDPLYVRFGFGRKLIQNAIERASRCVNKRRRIWATVSERNLTAQLFLQKCGFEWCHTVPGAFDLAGQSNDGYQFVRKLT
jgi:ribosomal protein S18 acetylase RimI-like enzyme